MSVGDNKNKLHLEELYFNVSEITVLLHVLDNLKNSFVLNPVL